MSRSTFALIIVAGVIAIFVLLQFTSRRHTATTLPEQMRSYWQPYTPDTKSFTSLFPQPPRKATQVMRNPLDKSQRRYNLYAAEQLDATVYLVQEVLFPKEEGQVDELSLVRSTIDEMVGNNSDNKLTRSEKVEYKGLPAIKFLIENKEATIEGLGFVKGDKLYLLTRASRKGYENSDDFDYFTEHFDFQPKA